MHIALAASSLEAAQCDTVTANQTCCRWGSLQPYISWLGHAKGCGYFEGPKWGCAIFIHTQQGPNSAPFLPWEPAETPLLIFKDVS